MYNNNVVRVIHVASDVTLITIYYLNNCEIIIVSILYLKKKITKSSGLDNIKLIDRAYNNVLTNFPMSSISVRPRFSGLWACGLFSLITQNVGFALKGRLRES